MKNPFLFWKKKPMTRIQKFRAYRQAILRMKLSQFQEAGLRMANEDESSPLPKAIGLMMWLLGGTVIILLIVVSALVYFGR